MGWTKIEKSNRFATINERERHRLKAKALVLKSYGFYQVHRSRTRHSHIVDGTSATATFTNNAALRNFLSGTYFKVLSGAGELWSLLSGARNTKRHPRPSPQMTKGSTGSSLKSWTHGMFSRVKKKFLHQPATRRHSSHVSKFSASEIKPTLSTIGSLIPPSSSSSKKRPTMSPPPHEVAAVVPPRLTSKHEPRPELSSCDSYFTLDRSNAASQYPYQVDETFCTSLEMKRKHDGSPSGRAKSLRGNHRVDADNDIIMTNDEDIAAERQISGEAAENSLPQRPPASFTTLPPEISLQVLQHLPLDSHAALYETNRHFQNLIVGNDDYLYDKQLRIAGSNPRSDSLLSRTIFAFQYSPNSPPDPVTELNVTAVKEKWTPQNNIQYLRFLAHQFRIVKKITDQLQSDFYYGFITSETGLKLLRLPAHGSHVPEDILVADDMDRDLMHLWEYVNFSAQMMSRDPGQRRYPYGRQQSFYCPPCPASASSAKLVNALTAQSAGPSSPASPLPPLNTRLAAAIPSESQPASPRSPSRRRRATGVEYPHNSFLTWERKHLRDARNEYWRESAENLSRLESRDMRWVLEVLKAAVVGKALGFLLKEETAPIQPPQMPSSLEQSISNANGSSEVAQNSFQQKALEVTMADAKPEADEQDGCTEMPRFPVFFETDLRAYVGYLIATAGLKLVYEILLASRKLGRSLNASELDALLEQWDEKRRQGLPMPAPSTTTVAGDEISPFDYKRIERIWERDCKMGGWSNWESWVADFYIL